MRYLPAHSFCLSLVVFPFAKLSQIKLSLLLFQTTNSEKSRLYNFKEDVYCTICLYVGAIIAAAPAAMLLPNKTSEKFDSIKLSVVK